MKDKKPFDRFHSRLRVEGVLKALVCGITIGFAVDLILALALWFTVSDGWWIAVVCGVAVAAICTPLLYFFVFRPTDLQVARRIDRLGLKERAVTMHELQGDESYIADCQRRDALECAARLSGKSLKIGVSRVGAIAMSGFVGLGGAMNIVAGLSHFGYLPLGSELIDGQDRESYYAVEYMVVDAACGYIIGEEIQVVEVGDETLVVTAEAFDGWAFWCWNDGVDTPTRYDLVDEDSVFIALFLPTRPSAGGDGEDSQMKQPGDEEGDPSDSSDSQNPQDPQDPKDQQDQSDKDPFQGASFTPPNGSENIIDGQTNYREVYDMYYQQAMQYLAENGSIPDNLRELVEAYFNSLK